MIPSRNNNDSFLFESPKPLQFNSYNNNDNGFRRPLQIENFNSPNNKKKRWATPPDPLEFNSPNYIQRWAIPSDPSEINAQNNNNELLATSPRPLQIDLNSTSNDSNKNRWGTPVRPFHFNSNNNRSNNKLNSKSNSKSKKSIPLQLEDFENENNFLMTPSIVETNQIINRRSKKTSKENADELREALFDSKKQITAKDIGINEQPSSTCESIIHSAKLMTKGGSSWQIYTKNMNGLDCVIKYIDHDLYKDTTNLKERKSRSKIGNYLKNIKNEIEINLIIKQYWNRVENTSHINVLVPMDVINCKEDPKLPFLIIYPKLGQNLETYLKKNSLHPDLFKDIFIDVTNGLIQLQKLDIYHNDLEPRNILLSNSFEDRIHFTISDFGVSIVQKLTGAEKFYDLAQFISYFNRYYPSSRTLLAMFDIKLSNEIFYTDIAHQLYEQYKTLEKFLNRIERI